MPGAFWAQVAQKSGADGIFRKTWLKFYQHGRQTLEGVFQKGEKLPSKPKEVGRLGIENRRVDPKLPSVFTKGVQLKDGKTRQLFDSMVYRASIQTFASQLRKNAAMKFLGGNLGKSVKHTPIFALVGLSLTANQNFDSEEDAGTYIFTQIRQLFKPCADSTSLDDLPTDVKLDNLEFGQLTSKGNNSTVYEARLKTNSVESPRIGNSYNKETNSPHNETVLDSLPDDDHEDDTASQSDSDYSVLSDQESIDDDVIMITDENIQSCAPLFFQTNPKILESTMEEEAIMITDENVRSCAPLFFQTGDDLQATAECDLSGIYETMLASFHETSNHDLGVTDAYHDLESADLDLGSEDDDNSDLCHLSDSDIPWNDPTSFIIFPGLTQTEALSLEMESATAKLNESDIIIISDDSTEVNVDNDMEFMGVISVHVATHDINDTESFTVLANDRIDIGSGKPSMSDSLEVRKDGPHCKMKDVYESAKQHTLTDDGMNYQPLISVNVLSPDLVPEHHYTALDNGWCDIGTTDTLQSESTDLIDDGPHCKMKNHSLSAEFLSSYNSDYFSPPQTSHGNYGDEKMWDRDIIIIEEEALADHTGQCSGDGGHDRTTTRVERQVINTGDDLDIESDDLDLPDESDDYWEDSDSEISLISDTETSYTWMRTDEEDYKVYPTPCLPAMESQYSDDVPEAIEQLVKKILKSDDKRVPSPEVAANLILIYLWGPKEWLSRKRPSQDEVIQWLLTMSAKLLFLESVKEQRSSCFQENRNVTGLWSDAELNLVRLFLSRVKMEEIEKSLMFNNSPSHVN